MNWVVQMHGMAQRLWQGMPAHVRQAPGPFIFSVLLLAFPSALLMVLISPSGPGRWMSLAFSCTIFLLWLVFVLGWSARSTVYAATSCSTVYLLAVSLTEGHLYSSTLAWLPLVPLAIFYVVHPRAGRICMLLVGLAQVLMAALAWRWGESLPRLAGPELPLMSLVDYLLATVTLFFVPNYYQKDLDRHLQERQAHHRMLQRQQIELEHMQQMQEHFIASVSHELRTPMNAILGLNAVLLDAVKEKPQAHKVLEYTRQSADHLMTVINDVLDHSQFSTGQLQARPETFELRQTVNAAFELFGPRVESTTLSYRCEIEADVPTWVNTDRHRLMQVLVNLLGNAIKFTHQGSVRLRVRRLDGGVEFSVTDSGIGLSAAQQSRIFEQYQQADSSIQSRYGGNGLGLTISRRLVQMLGGHMGLESEPGAGACFWFWLPLQAVPAPAPALPDAALNPEQSPQHLRFLVVDDHPVNRLLVRQVLRQHWPGSQVDECDNGAKALQALDAGAYDLVLMDMVMPVMDGIEATGQIRGRPDARVRGTPVLGLTANVSPGDLQRFEQAGLSGLLLKPFEVERLRAEVLRLVTAPPRQG